MGENTDKLISTNCMWIWLHVLTNFFTPPNWYSKLEHKNDHLYNITGIKILSKNGTIFQLELFFMIKLLLYLYSLIYVKVWKFISNMVAKVCMHESLSAFKRKINQKLCTLVNQYVCSQNFSVNCIVFLQWYWNHIYLSHSFLKKLCANCCL